MQFSPLYNFKVNGTLEKLGRVPDGERSKVEFRGSIDSGSKITGKMHGTHWFLIGPLGNGQLESVQEIVTASGDRFVLQLRGFATVVQEGEMQIKGCGVIRASAAPFMHLDGHIAVLEGSVRGDGVEVAVWCW